MAQYQGDDEKAMEDDNSSAFNCRPITGQPGVFSQHSYGVAIDINTRVNPYVKGSTILPTNAYDYSKPHIGKIVHGDATYELFINDGFTWSGDWTSLKDYQHFEKVWDNSPCPS